MNVQEKAKRIFDAIFDEEDLKNLESKGVIAQELGYKVSVIAQIELELESEWVSVSDLSMLELPFESEEDPDADGYPQFDGMVSQTVEVTDGESRSFGHYRDDGVWNIYIRGHDLDFLNVNPKNVTHYRVLDKLPMPPRAED